MSPESPEPQDWSRYKPLSPAEKLLVRNILPKLESPIRKAPSPLPPPSAAADDLADAKAAVLSSFRSAATPGQPAEGVGKAPYGAGLPPTPPSTAAGKASKSPRAAVGLQRMISPPRVVTQPLAAGERSGGSGGDSSNPESPQSMQSAATAESNELILKLQVATPPAVPN